MTPAALRRLRCPRCHAPMGEASICPACGPFETARGQPVLIDFERSIIDREQLSRSGGASPIGRSGWRTRLKRRVFGTNSVAARIAQDVSGRIGPDGEVLVIGGGEIGSGAEALYSRVRVVGLDIYASPHTQLVADAHDLPFLDETFDAVWIQAVLEHVIDPTRVVEEIHRVLRPAGLVFADTPFLQHVHEGAYDFTRFTLSGHRWLFRRFDLLEAGATAGAGTSLLWALRGFVGALTGSRGLARAAGALFFWLPWFDRQTPSHEDVACGVYFYGSKGQATLTARDMVGFYAQRR